MKTKKIGLALGGGGARGMTHLGVIRALLRNKIPIHYIAGTSSGSLVGGTYAACLDIEKLIHITTTINWKDIVGFSFSKRGLVSTSGIAKLIETKLGTYRFKDLKIPFSSIATHILTGQETIFNNPEMLIETAIQASIAIPGVFMPVKIDDDYYFDGGVQNNVPISVVKAMGADVVIAIDVIPDIPLSKVPSQLLYVADRAVDLLLKKIQKEKKEDNINTIILEPLTEYMSALDMKFAQRLIELGEISVENNLTKIQKLIQ